MTISGYVSQLPIEVLYAPTDSPEYVSQIMAEVLVVPQSDLVYEYLSQIVIEVVSLQYYTEEPILGDNINYFVGDQSTDKNPNKVHPGGHVGVKGSVITLLAFENIQVPQAAIIKEAYITFTASDSDSTTTVNANIVALDEDNPEIPQTYAELILAPTTTAYAVWNDISAWVAENEYNSVELKSVVQEIVNRVGWERGNTIVILFEDSSSTPNSYRRAYSKLTSGKEPKLTILWDYEEASSIGAPTLYAINNPLASDSYTVSWSTVGGATSYELWEQFEEEEWSMVYTGALTSKDFSGKDGGIWSYRVRAYDGADYSIFSNVESTGVAKALSSKINLGISF